MNNINWKKIIPHVVAIGIFLVLCFFYFSPVMEGKVLAQSDISHFKGMSKEIVDHRDLYEEEPLWTNSMFGGMPATQISIKYGNNAITFIHSLLMLGLPHPVNYVFLYMLGFYILLLCLRVNPWLAVVGAIGFAFSSYFFIILEAGHNSKAVAIAYMAPVLGAFLLTYRRNWMLGGTLMALFLALEINANHVQVTYYLFMVLIAVGIVELIRAIKSRTLPDFGKRTGVLAIAVVLALGANVANLWSTYEYGKITTRGASDITIKPEGVTSEKNDSGLDPGYITAWSYGTGETMTLLIPNAKGGASGFLGYNESFVKEADPQLQQFVMDQVRTYSNTGGRDGVQFSEYFGDQTFTSGPVYIGAVIIMLFVLGMFFLEGNLRWALFAVAVLSIVLAWGRNWLFGGNPIGELNNPITNFFIDHVPGYNKFRAVTIILIIAELVIPLLGILLVKKLMDEQDLFARKKKLYLGVAGGLIAFVAIVTAMPDAFFKFTTTQEMLALENPTPPEGFMGTAESYQAVVQDNVSKLEEFRIGVFQSDALRTLGLLLLTAGLLYFYSVKQAIGKKFLIGALGVFILGDLLLVDLRYLNNEKDPQSGEYISWIDPEFKTRPFQASSADYTILYSEIAQNPALNDAITARLTQMRDKKKAENPTNFQLTAQEEVDAYFGTLNANTNYRVLNTLGRLDQDSRTSYYHKSLGGYHGAKLRRYQDLVDFYLADNTYMIKALWGAYSGAPPAPFADSLVATMKVAHMLNTKYIITGNGGSNPDKVTYWNPAAGQMGLSPETPGIINPYALGNAWFVSDVQIKNSEDEVITAMGSETWEPGYTALVAPDMASFVEGFAPTPDPNGSIKLTSYKANHLMYEFNAASEQLVVFSEVFYDNGWTMYVDGQEQPHLRVNYILRAARIPGGQHSVEFKYDAKSYSTGSTVNLASSIIILLLVLGVIYKSGAIQSLKSD